MHVSIELLPQGQDSVLPIAERLNVVTELVKGFDGSTVSKSLIRRSVLRSILHLPFNHGATQALDLFYEALDQATLKVATARSRSKAPSVSHLVKIWLEARKAIEITTARQSRKKAG